MMKTRFFCVLLAFCTGLFVSCADDVSEDGPGPDTGGFDTGTSDASGNDAGPSTDASGEDVSEDDAGIDMPPPEPIEVTWPENPIDYVDTSEQASYLSRLIVPGMTDGRPDCCVDFGERSRLPGIDNGMVRLAVQAEAFEIDAQQLADSALSTGRMVGLFDHRELDGQDDPDDFALVWLRGRFEGATDYDSASQGNGTFRVTADNFDGASGEPINVFNPAKMENGQLTAGPGSFSLLVPFGITSLDMPVYEVHLKATATVDVDGVEYVAGEMGGYVKLAELFGRLNEMVAERCGCLDMEGTLLFLKENNQWQGNCVDEAATLCTEQSERLCRVLAGTDISTLGVCGVLPGIIQKAADMDLEDPGDGVYEGISIGFGWTAVKADIVELDP